MDKTRQKAVLEAVLFTMGESVEISKLAEVIEEDVKTQCQISIVKKKRKRRCKEMQRYSMLLGWKN